jgi:hypothetical protein
MRKPVLFSVLTGALLLPGSNVPGYYGGGYGDSPGTTPTATTVKGTLTGVVGPGFTITLKKKSGKLVQKLAPGTWRIVVDDKSSVHNFHLTGQGVAKTTTVAQVKKVTWTVTFVAGKTYTYKCDPHQGTMIGTFKIKSA